jgi:hypothetical protein
LKNGKQNELLSELKIEPAGTACISRGQPRMTSRQQYGSYCTHGAPTPADIWRAATPEQQLPRRRQARRLHSSAHFLWIRLLAMWVDFLQVIVLNNYYFHAKK